MMGVKRMEIVQKRRCREQRLAGDDDGEHELELIIWFEREVEGVGEKDCCLKRERVRCCKKRKWRRRRCARNRERKREWESGNTNGGR
jgi:hypothetical protein